MKIGLYCSGISPEGGGGYTLQNDLIETLSRLSGETRHAFTIFTSAPEAIRPLITSPAIRLLSLPPASLFKRDIRRVLNALKRRLPAGFGKSNDPYAQHSPLEQSARAHGIKLIWFLTAAAVPVDMPYVATVFDLQHRLQPYFPEVGAYPVWKEREWHFAQYLQRASRIIIGSRAGQEQIERFYQIPADRIRILLHPTPGFTLNAASESDEAVLKKYAIPEPYLFYPAQFWAHKNHANLLFALYELRRKKNLILPLVLVGTDAGNLNYIKKLIKELDLTAQVKIPGFVPRADLLALYRRALALTYLTFFGPDNLPPLEAFALGCPVIASDIPGALEQLNDAALLVDPQNPEAIAESILNFYRDPKLRDIFIQRGRERSKRWTAEHFVRGMFQILDEFESIRRCWE